MYENYQRKADSVGELFCQLGEGTDVKNDILLHYIEKLERIAKNVYESNSIQTSVTVEDVTQEVITDFWKWLTSIQGNGRCMKASVGSKMDSIGKRVLHLISNDQCELMDEEGLASVVDVDVDNNSSQYYTELIELKRDFNELMERLELFDLTKRHNKLILRWLKGEEIDPEDNRYLHNFGIRKLKIIMERKCRQIKFEDWVVIIQAFNK